MYVGTTGGADNFCLQMSSVPIGRIGIFWFSNGVFWDWHFMLKLRGEGVGGLPQENFQKLVLI